MNNLQIFVYSGEQLRTVQRDDGLWWVLRDVCRVLGMSNPAMVAGRLDEDERADVSLPYVSESEAKRYIREAAISVTVWNGQFERYYAFDGATYVNIVKQEIRTAYSKEEFTDNVRTLVEEMKKNGLLG